MSAKILVLLICCAAVHAQYQFSPASFYGSNLGNGGSLGSGGQAGSLGGNQGQRSLGYFGAYGAQGQGSLGYFGNYGGQGNQGGSGGNEGSSFGGSQGSSAQNYFGYWARNLALYGNDGFNPGNFGGSQGQGNQALGFGVGRGNQGSGGQGFGVQGSGNQGYATSYSNAQYGGAINFPYTRPAIVIAHVPQQITSSVPVVQTNEEPYDHNPVYNFAYSVSDAHTGDHKSQEESRQGDSVRGQYSLIEPDGTQRTVNYAVEPHSGFNALVQRTQVHH